MHRGQVRSQRKERTPQNAPAFLCVQSRPPTLHENSKWTQSTGKRPGTGRWWLRVWGFRGEGNVEVATPVYECARNCSVVHFKLFTRE